MSTYEEEIEATSTMTDDRRLTIYTTALCQLVKENGGYLKLGPHDLDESGSLMNRPTEDGGIEFRYVVDGQAT